MHGVFAEFETNLRRERQMEGIAKAKARKALQYQTPAESSLSVLRRPVESTALTSVRKRINTISRKLTFAKETNQLTE